MDILERLLVDLESGPLSAITRVALGMSIPPLFRALSAARESVWMSVALFLGLLVVLRVVPAAVRYALPFSAKVKALWAQRRHLAKDHDSYQWQKLFWIGLGLLLYAFIDDGLS